MKQHLSLAVAMIGAVTTGNAEPTGLSGDALRKTISGRTILLDTPVGGLPISYQPNGTLSGKASGMQNLAGLKNDRGRWWIAANKVCQKWETWLDGREYCYQMRFEGKLVHWKRSDGRTGTAKVVSQ